MGQSEILDTWTTKVSMIELDTHISENSNKKDPMKSMFQSVTNRKNQRPRTATSDIGMHFRA